MALERRNGNVYFYSSHRVGKRVRKEFVASGPAAVLAARWEAVRAAGRKLDR